ncbi:MAG: alpha/beta fold hydrolase, partial [Hyphomicrobiaceae bacterium]
MATMNVSGVELEIAERGSGRPLLFLHAGEGLWADRPWLDLLSAQFRVIAPTHPGWGGGSTLPDWIGTVDDLAYLYLDLARQMELDDAILVGASFGGWIAAEMAVRNTAAFAKIVLAAPLGIKVGDRDTRDIADMHSMTREAFVERAWADPLRDPFDPKALSDAALKGIVEGREALALFAWKPYMHNPRLKNWLHRIDKPVQLVWGAQDRIVTPAYGEAFAAAIPGAR